MKPILTRSDSCGVFDDDERVHELWETIKEKLSKVITPDIWISEINDHKGCLRVKWFVRPTVNLKKEIDEIWEKKFFETYTEHIFEPLI